MTMYDSYFAMKQQVMSKKPDDELKELTKSSAESDTQKTAPEHNEEKPVDQSNDDTKQSEPASNVKNSYLGAESDTDISNFANDIGKNRSANTEYTMPPDQPAPVTPESVPHDRVLSEPDRSEKQTAAKSVVLGNAFDQKIKVDYDAARKANIQFSNLKSVPMDLVALAAEYFPNASNKTDAVAAYIYIKEGCPPDVNIPDEIKEIAKSYTGTITTVEDSTSLLSRDIMDLRSYVQKQLLELASRLYTVEMLIGYSLFDQLEFSQSTAPTPADVDFGESGFSDMLKHAEKEAQKQYKKAIYDKNRPY